MRSERKKDLIRVLRGGHARTQQEIVEALRALGHDVTQATVSRDLQGIGALKVRTSGHLEYRLPDEIPRSGGDLMTRNLIRTLEEFALEVKAAGSLVVVVTAPGHASAVARAIDLGGSDTVMGTVAGDDTIFVATPGVEQANDLARRWKSLTAQDEGTEGEITG